MSLPLICIAVLSALLILLGFNVSLVRARTHKVGGCGEALDDPLYKASRAHGNSVEYIPLLCIIIYILSLSPQPMWVTVSMVGVTVCRISLALGLLLPKTMAKPNPARFVGALGTYIFALILVFALFLTAF